MAQAFQCRLRGEGGRIRHTASGAIAAGDVLIINGMFTFATQPIANAAMGTMRCAGGPPLVEVVKATGGISVGNAVYWDADGSPVGGTALSGAATTTSTANTFIGRCIEAAGSSAETVLVECSIGVVVAGGLENEITDPGDGEAIPVTATGHCGLVSTGADTRTLAAPSFVGQQLLLFHKTDGGSCVVTCATTVNGTGNDTITFTNVGDSILLHAIAEGSNLRWRCAVADGAALTTA